VVREDSIEVSVPLGDKAELDSQPNATFNIELGEWDSDLRIPISRLDDIYEFVKNMVMPRFVRFDREVTHGPPYRVDPVKTVYYR
jgi:hypothetical protein